MSLTLVIECGVAQTRAALLDDDRVSRLWFGAARGDEAADIQALPGRQFIGRVKSVNRSLKAAFIDIGGAQDAFLNLNKTLDTKIIEGALIAVSVKSSPRQEKGAVVKFVDIAPGGQMSGRREPLLDAVLEAVEAIGSKAEQIITDSGAACAVLNASGLAAEVLHETSGPGLFEKYGVESELEAALGINVNIPGGGTLTIDEGQALTAVDVDSAALTAASDVALREKMTIAAAYEAVHQICMRNIGGHVVIDFPPIKGQAARKRFNEQLNIAMKQLVGAGGAGFSKSGLFCFTFPQGGQSLQERFTENAKEAFLPGRKFTLAYQARLAIQNLEAQLRSAPRTQFYLHVGSGLQSYLKSHEMWLGRLKDRYGARFEIRLDEKQEEQTFELCEQ